MVVRGVLPPSGTPLAGPNEEARSKSRGTLVAEAQGADGAVARARLHIPDAYDLTAEAAVELARRAAEGALPVGFQTPSTAAGPDFVLELTGCTREDLA